MLLLLPWNLHKDKWNLRLEGEKKKHSSRILEEISRSLWAKSMVIFTQREGNFPHVIRVHDNKLEMSRYDKGICKNKFPICWGLEKQ